MQSDTIRQALDRAASETLLPVSSGLSLLYLLFAISHALLLPQNLAMIMVPIALATSLSLFTFRSLLVRKPLEPRFAHPASAVICVLVLTNALTHCFLVHDLVHSTDLMLLIVGAGILFMSLRWLTLIIALTVLGWVLVVSSVGWTTPGTVHFAIALLSAIAISLISYAVHFRTYSKLELARCELRNLSLTDPLTELNNRRGLDTIGEQELRLAKRMGQPITFLFIDLDDMKPINDTLGHEAGDAALIETARLLKRNTREADIVARIGGDEFCVLLSGDNSGAQSMIERIQSELEERNAGNCAYKLRLSIGSVLYDPDKHADLSALVKDADESMYKMKLKRKSALEKS